MGTVVDLRPCNLCTVISSEFSPRGDLYFAENDHHHHHHHPGGNSKIVEVYLKKKNTLEGKVHGESSEKHTQTLRPFPYLFNFCATTPITTTNTTTAKS